MTEFADGAGLQSLVEEVIRQQSALLRRLEGLETRLDTAIGRLERVAPGATVQSASVLPADIEGRRDALRPAVLRLLFVTAPIFPEDTTNFYLANSHLFRCIRGAFVRAVGPDVPTGDDFLRFFRGTGSWLVHLPAEPKRGRGRPNKSVMRSRAAFLTEVLRSANPERVIGVKARLAPLLASSVHEAGLSQDRVEVFPTPRALWSPRFVRELRQALGYGNTSAGEPGLAATDSLLEAVQRSIAAQGNKRRRARDIADDVNDRGRYRTDMGYVSKAAVSAEIRRHPDVFDVNSAGVRLRSLAAFPAGHPTRRAVPDPVRQ